MFVHSVYPIIANGITRITYAYENNLRRMTVLCDYHSVNQVESLLSAYTTFSYDATGNPARFKGTAHTYNANSQLSDVGYASDARRAVLLHR